MSRAGFHVTAPQNVVAIFFIIIIDFIKINLLSTPRKESAIP
jgi:hypothetical protein